MSTIFPPSNLPQVSQKWANLMQQQLVNLQNTVNGIVANNGNVNKAQNSTMKTLGNKIANVQALVQTAISSITISGSQITSGSINPGGSVTGSDLYTINGPSYNITGTRVAAWLESATGRVGMATSSERYKTAIQDATTDPQAILGISVRYYQYTAETAKAEADPSYHVSTNIGMIAEDLHAAGLWEFVVYQRDENDNIVIDENGQPVPDGIHYEMFAVGVLIAAQSLNTRLTALEDRMNALEGNS